MQPALAAPARSTMEISTPGLRPISASDCAGIFIMWPVLPGCTFVLFLWYVAPRFSEVGPERRPATLFVTLLIICGYYELWAIKNRCFGPVKSNAGVFAFIPGLAAGAAALSLMLWTECGGTYVPMPTGRHMCRGAVADDIVNIFGIGGTLAPTFYFAVPIVWFIKSRAGPRQVAEKWNTSLAWAWVFYLYAWFSFFYWPAAAVVGGILGAESEWWTALLGGLLSLVYAAVLKCLIDRDKARALQRQPARAAAATYERGEYLPPDLSIVGGPVAPSVPAEPPPAFA